MSQAPAPASIGMGRSVYRKRNVVGDLVVVLQMLRRNRKMHLEADLASRALMQGEIHELVVTDQEDVSLGSDVLDVAYYGFFEVTQGSVAHVGDELRIGGKLRGRLAGFDTTHVPNHYNIIFKIEHLEHGREAGLEVGDQVVISAADE
jgi:hypothetical protein